MRSSLKQKITIATFIIGLTTYTTVMADHLPEELLANGPAETILAGINLKTTKLDEVLRRYGPASRKVTAPNNPAWSGYIWELPHAKLEVSVSHSPKGDLIDNVYVEGTAGGTLGQTGKGLRLGDDIKSLKHIYGNRFEIRNRSVEAKTPRQELTGVQLSTGVIQVATIQWKSEEFTLSVGFNSDKKVCSMWLVLPECYPGECE